MKQILVLLVLSLSLNTYSQNLKDLQTLPKIPIDYGHSSSWIGVETVSIYESGKIEVKGDSIIAIKSLLKLVEKLTIEKEATLRVLEKSVNWSNTVPDHWKKNREWYKYLLSIEKFGYKSEKIKK